MSSLHSEESKRLASDRSSRKSGSSFVAAHLVDSLRAENPWLRGRLHPIILCVSTDRSNMIQCFQKFREIRFQEFSGTLQTISDEVRIIDVHQGDWALLS